ncbi:MAG: hypothetical protein AAF518_25990 [Spirochaetota bacterium]
MQFKKLFDEIFKEVLREILHRHHLEVEYEIPGNPKRVDFYLEAKDVPINSTMVYLKVFAKYNLMEFKSEGDRFRQDDIYKIHTYLANFLVRYPKKASKLRFILFCSVTPRLLFKKCRMTKVKPGIYKTLDTKLLAPLYVVVISELPADQKGEVEKIRLFQEKKQLDSYLHESIVKKRDLKYAMLLYRKRLQKIAKRLGVDMTAIEERVQEIAQEMGLLTIEAVQKKYKLREKRANRKSKLQIALKMKREGFTLAIITKITEIPEQRLKRFFARVKES